MNYFIKQFKILLLFSLIVLEFSLFSIIEYVKSGVFYVGVWIELQG